VAQQAKSRTGPGFSSPFLAAVRIPAAARGPVDDRAQALERSRPYPSDPVGCCLVEFATFYERNGGGEHRPDDHRGGHETMIGK